MQIESQRASSPSEKRIRKIPAMLTAGQGDALVARISIESQFTAALAFEQRNVPFLNNAIINEKLKNLIYLTWTPAVSLKRVAAFTADRHVAQVTGPSYCKLYILVFLE